MTITVLPGGALHLIDPGPCPACSAVVAEPSPEVLAASVAAAAATLRSSGVSDLAEQAAAYARRLQDDPAFRDAEWRRQNQAWLSAARSETSGGVARLPVGAHYRAVALPGGFLRYSAPNEIQEFDADGRLARIISHGGLVREIVRDAEGHIRRIADAAGHSISFERDASGRAIRAVAGSGKEARFGYDASGRLAWSEGSDGRLEYGWSNGGQLTSVTGQGVEIRATYLPPSQGGKLASLSTDEGSTERYSYERHADGLVQVTEVHDEWRDGLHPIPTGKVDPWMRSEATAARRFTYVEPLGNDGRRFVWQQTVEEDDESRVTIYDHRTFRPIAISSGNSTTELRYDDFGRVVERRKAGSVTLVEYAPGGRVSRVVRRTSDGEENEDSLFEATFKYDLQVRPSRRPRRGVRHRRPARLGGV
jgi:YD repeat-containing protein